MIKLSVHVSSFAAVCSYTKYFALHALEASFHGNCTRLRTRRCSLTSMQSMASSPCTCSGTGWPWLNSCELPTGTRLMDGYHGGTISLASLLVNYPTRLPVNVSRLGLKLIRYFYHWHRIWNLDG